MTTGVEQTVAFKPKLIEVALPLDAINEASAREKSLRHGHPSTLHLWWARRPLAACRAVLWASLVDDPSAHPDKFPTEEDQAIERERLFGILERLVVWENSNDPKVLAEAKEEIWKCFDGNPPPVLDPFAGGGSIPLESQRLGLQTLASDLNPVAVLINKAMVEIPPRFAGLPPVHPEAKTKRVSWSRAEGLAADVEAYGKWMKEEAERKVGYLYPKVEGPEGEMLTPIAWIWARTVKSPDPSWDGHVPLVASWVLRNKSNKPKIAVEPIVCSDSMSITYKVRQRDIVDTAGTINRGNGLCIATGATIPVSYIIEEALQGRMGRHLLAIVAGKKGNKRYCSADRETSEVADISIANLKVLSTGKLPPKGQGLGFRVQAYGMDEWWKLFSDRQIYALSTFSDLLKVTKIRILKDAQEYSQTNNGKKMEEYADAVVTYLAFAVDKLISYMSTLCSWNKESEAIRSTFGLQTMSMNWDYAELNPFSKASANWSSQVNWICKVLRNLPDASSSEVIQMDARTRTELESNVVISTDPPYYNNIGYANISDFFYVWLRINLKEIYQDLFSTLFTPKAEELIADPGRHGGMEGARKHFESGIADFFKCLVKAQYSTVPATIHYGYKASEITEEGKVISTGWDTFLQGIIDAGLQITATWPLRTERKGRLVSIGANALASSVVLACRPKSTKSKIATRSEFLNALWSELPRDVKLLQQGNIAPVDLPQTTIGPGIRIFSSFKRVIESDGTSMKVSEALAIINDVLDEILHGEESEFDAETRFALAWYGQYGFEAGAFGDADSIARAKNTAVQGVVEAGIGISQAGKFRLTSRTELDPKWDPLSDDRLTVWEATQHMIATIEKSESEAEELLGKLGQGYADQARQLAYLLYKIANDNGWAEEATAYNGLIQTWSALRPATTISTNQQQLI